MSEGLEEQTPELNRLNIDPEQAATNAELLRRLIRLMVGMVLVAQDALRRELPRWEAEAAQRLAEMEQTGSQDFFPAETSKADIEELSDEQTPWFPASWEYRLVGLAFSSPKYLQSAFSTFMRAPKGIWRMTAPLRLPFDYLGVTEYSRAWLENVMNQVKEDLDRLEEIGKQEAIPSRGLAYVAILKSYEAFFNSLSQNEDVQNLIQQQSMGLTTEVMEEVRERAVSLDIATDAILRRLLHLKPTMPSPHSPNQPPANDEGRDPSW